MTTRLCMAGYNEKRLLHDLLDSYNILERPVVNESDPLQLSFGLTLMQIIDVVIHWLRGPWCVVCPITFDGIRKA
uniref:Neurotransmitter-gated ion-channel ligand-binding domain-containing protein n=1 Tax=Anopheles albimanus TaxID=7167 RepID=A0A182F0U8_ANOAL